MKVTYYQKMKLLKIKKTNIIHKIVLPILLFFGIVEFGFSQQTNNQTNNQNTEEKTLPTTKKTAGEAKKPKQQPNLIPTTGDKDVRAVTLEPTDESTIQAEEARRIRMEEELAKDEAKQRIIKRTFGSSIFTNTMFDINQAINIATPSNYVLGPGDKLSVNVSGNIQLAQVSPVDADGYISFERGGSIYVMGLNIAEAESKVRSSLSRAYPSLAMGGASLRLSLTGFRTIKISVNGEVVAPGTYTVTSFSDMMIALHVSGGPNDIGTYRDIKLIRNNQVVASLDLYDILVNGYSKDNILLRDQDIIQVGPYESRVAVSGETKRVGLFEVKANDKISDLIRYSGGFSQNAYSELVKVYRNTQRERQILDIPKEKYNSEKVFSGDSLVVERILDRIENLVSIEGAVYREGEYSLNTNQTLAKLIESAGGLKEESLGGRINIHRTNEDLSLSNLSLNYLDIKEGRQNDIPLKKFDHIFVPSVFELTEKAVIKIQGAINNEDAKDGVEIPYVKDMTIQDVLVRVGGLTEAASLSRGEIVRRKRNIDTKVSDAQIADIFTFKIRPDLSLVEGYESVKLMPFDEIIIRNSPNYEKQKFVTISGEVMYPGPYGIEYKDQRVSDIISSAGGLTDLAYLKGAKLFRKTLLSEKQRERRDETLANLNLIKNIKQTEGLETDVDNVKTVTTEGVEADSYINDEIGLDFEKILKHPGNDRYDMILQDGDEIVIPKRLETVRIEGEVLYPNSAKYLPNKPFLSYITEAGGFTKKSAKVNSIIVYPNGSVDRTRKFLFFRFYPKVEPGSEIIVPAKTETVLDQFGQASGFLSTLSTTIVTALSIITIFRLK